MTHVCLILASLLALLVAAGTTRVAPAVSAQAGPRPRVIVSTDIGGTDPDDFQSMVHFMVYADMFDVEGLVSSPYGPGRREHILEVIERYAADYSNLKAYSDRYPPPDELRRVTKEGSLDPAGGSGVGRPTEGSDAIVRAARRNDPRPLWILVWGGIDDLAQALHDAPDILPKLRVYFIGGPNKMWSVDAYNYIEQHHPALWIVEANATYRGWFTGGNQTGEWDNTAFVAAHVAGRGALGDYFATRLKGTIKMGDSPSVGYLLHGTPDAPSQPGWGGRFVRVWDGRKTVFERLTTEADKAEVFGVVEFTLPAPAGMTSAHSARMIFDGRIPAVATRRGPRAAIPLLAARRQGVAVHDSQRLSRPRRPVGLVHRGPAACRANRCAFFSASPLVDRRSRSRCRRGRPSGREEREPVARGVPA